MDTRVTPLLCGESFLVKVNGMKGIEVAQYWHWHRPTLAGRVGSDPHWHAPHGRGRSDDHYIIANDITPRAESRHNVTGVGKYHTGHRSCSACNARQKNES